MPNWIYALAGLGNEKKWAFSFRKDYDIKDVSLFCHKMSIVCTVNLPVVQTNKFYYEPYLSKEKLLKFH